AAQPGEALGEWRIARRGIGQFDPHLRTTDARPQVSEHDAVDEQLIRGGFGRLIALSHDGYNGHRERQPDQSPRSREATTAYRRLPTPAAPAPRRIIHLPAGCGRWPLFPASPTPRRPKAFGYACGPPPIASVSQ